MSAGPEVRDSRLEASIHGKARKAMSGAYTEAYT
jgi:hypothetical protein